MSPSEHEDKTIYKVIAVVSYGYRHYEIVPVDRPTPPGWEDTGKSGPKSECETYVTACRMRPY